MTAHVNVYPQTLFKFQSWKMMFRFHGSAGLSECGGKSVHMQSVGEERNEYTYFSV